jgi:hypothetical protein
MQALSVTGTTLKLTDNVSDIGSRFGKELIKLTRGKVFHIADRPMDWRGTVILIIQRT